eukprot:TRINITY_DN1425_c0_g1_i2.p1 TRINITY_DN1425_c0_g1~~TRINITY_DN1425_c0_g1_i2.p1  ORF type:complete len:3048 (-),score=746.58 TRINITY_DN1425_c0_g1_i2:25-9168(-)
MDKIMVIIEFSHVSKKTKATTFEFEASSTPRHILQTLAGRGLITPSSANKDLPDAEYDLVKADSEHPLDPGDSIVAQGLRAMDILIVKKAPTSSSGSKRGFFGRSRSKDTPKQTPPTTSPPTPSSPSMLRTTSAYSQAASLPTNMSKSVSTPSIEVSTKADITSSPSKSFTPLSSSPSSSSPFTSFLKHAGSPAPAPAGDVAPHTHVTPLRLPSSLHSPPPTHIHAATPAATPSPTATVPLAQAKIARKGLLRSLSRSFSQDEPANAKHTAGKPLFGIPLASAIANSPKIISGVPEFLERALSHVEANGDLQGLFQTRGNQINVDKLRLQIEEGDVNMAAYDPRVASDLVIQFLTSLPDSLISTRIYDTLVKEFDLPPAQGTTTLPSATFHTSNIPHTSSSFFSHSTHSSTSPPPLPANHALPGSSGASLWIRKASSLFSKLPEENILVLKRLLATLRRLSVRAAIDSDKPPAGGAGQEGGGVSRVDDMAGALGQAIFKTKASPTADQAAKMKAIVKALTQGYDFLFAFLVTSKLDTLPGEAILSRQEDIAISHLTGQPVSDSLPPWTLGVLWVTSFRLVWRNSDPDVMSRDHYDTTEVVIPHGAILHLERCRSANWRPATKSLACLKIFCRDFRCEGIGMPDKNTCKKLFRALHHHVNTYTLGPVMPPAPDQGPSSYTSTGAPDRHFAFANREMPVSENGPGASPPTIERSLFTSGSSESLAWDAYDIFEETARLGLVLVHNKKGEATMRYELGSLDGMWRVAVANKDYEVCCAYPSRILVPACVSDKQIAACAASRDYARFPSFAWKHPTNHALLVRSGPNVDTHAQKPPTPSRVDPADNPDRKVLQAMLKTCEFWRGYKSGAPNQAPATPKERTPIPTPATPATPTTSSSAATTPTSSPAGKDASGPHTPTRTHEPHTPGTPPPPPMMMSSPMLNSAGKGTRSMRSPSGTIPYLGGLGPKSPRSDVGQSGGDPKAQGEPTITFMVVNIGKGRSTSSMIRYPAEINSLMFAEVSSPSDMQASLLTLYEAVHNVPHADQRWKAKVDDTVWLNHIRSLVTTARKVANMVSGGQSVMVQGAVADGHDLTECCLVSLAMLLLDPFYRTIKGFCVLVQKEWSHYAFPFRAQMQGMLGQGADEDMGGPDPSGSDLPDANSTSAHYGELAPTFLQFLDAVWQVLKEFPTAFEFSEDFLLFMADQSYSGRFGNFLSGLDKPFARGEPGSKERGTDRKGLEKALKRNTVSLWTFAEVFSDAFANLSYIPYEEQKDAQTTPPAPSTPTRISESSSGSFTSMSAACLMPDVQPVNFRLWAPYYLRHATITDCPTYFKRLSGCGAGMANEPLPGTHPRSLDLSNLMLAFLPSAPNPSLPALLPAPSGKQHTDHLLETPTPIKGALSLATLTVLEALDLSHNHLTLVPLEILSLSSLRKLSLAHNAIRTLPHSIYLKAWGAYGMRELDLTNCMISMLPPSAELARLTQLTHLLLVNNRIADLARLPHLPALEVLDVSSNALLIVPPPVMTLPALKTLRVTNNSISTLPTVDGALPNITTLVLNQNRLEDFPLAVTRLSTLQTLDISNNTIKELPYQMGDLVSLVSLNARVNHIHYVGKGLARLTNLTDLDLSHNHLPEVPVELCKIMRLTTLNLSNNTIVDCPPEICQLLVLSDLDLSHNTISELSPAIGHIPSLGRLDLRGNPLTTFPLTMGNLVIMLRDLLFDQNKITFPPPEVCARGTDHLLYFLGTQLRGSSVANRVKLMVVGRENVGKTSLLNCLRSKSAKFADNCNTISTDGIDLGTWMLPIVEEKSGKKQTVAVSVWDCAGQEVYYTTHQFFLSDQTIYILVWNMADTSSSSSSYTANQSGMASMDNEDTKIEYWLRTLRARIGNSPSHPVVFIVGTHLDDPACARECGVVLQHQRAKYTAMFPRFQMFFRAVSCTSGEGINSLRKELQQVIAKGKFIGRTVPMSWTLLERYLMREAKKRMPPVLSYPEVERIGLICGLGGLTTSHLFQALTFLHNVGALVHFQRHVSPYGAATSASLQGNGVVEGLVCLDPQWLVTTMATLFTTRHQWVRNGVIRSTDLIHIWRPPMYPFSIHPAMLSLAQKFEIAHLLEWGSLDNARTLHRSITPTLTPVSSAQSTPPNRPKPGPLVRESSTSSSVLTVDDSPGPAESPEPAGSPLLSSSSGRSLSRTASSSSGGRTTSSDQMISALGVQGDFDILVPALLPAEAPQDLARVWNENIWGENTSFLTMGRKYRLEFVPLGLFSRIVARLLDFTKVTRIWRDGILAEAEPGYTHTSRPPSPQTVKLTSPAAGRDPRAAFASHGRSASGANLLTHLSTSGDSNVTPGTAAEGRNRSMSESGAGLAKLQSSKAEGEDPDTPEGEADVSIQSTAARPPPVSHPSGLVRNPSVSEGLRRTISRRQLSRQNSDLSLPKERLLVMVDVPTGMITVQVRATDTPVMAKAVFETIESLSRDWYKLEMQVFVPCTHCLTSIYTPNTGSDVNAKRQVTRTWSWNTIRAAHERPQPGAPSIDENGPGTMPRTHSGNLADPSRQGRNLNRTQSGSASRAPTSSASSTPSGGSPLGSPDTMSDSGLSSSPSSPTMSSLHMPSPPVLSSLTTVKSFPGSGASVNPPSGGGSNLSTSTGKKKGSFLGITPFTPSSLLSAPAAPVSSPPPSLAPLFPTPAMPLNVHYFTLEECEAAALAGTHTVTCNQGGVATEVRLLDLVPDLLLTQFSGRTIPFSQIKLGIHIGGGGAADVYKAEWMGQTVAVKKLRGEGLLAPTGGGEIALNVMSPEERASFSRIFAEFRREVWLMNGLAHPNLVRFEGICLKPLCIVQEYLDAGDLHRYLHDSSKSLSWPTRIRLARDIASGMCYLHEQEIMHRDLKSPNILLHLSKPSQSPELGSLDDSAKGEQGEQAEETRLVAKVCDFGLSGLTSAMTGRVVANPVWLAPEIIRGDAHIAKGDLPKGDVYSFGVILWELASRGDFFAEEKFMSSLEERVLAGDRPFIPPDCPPEYASLIMRCWATEPATRPPFAEALEVLDALIANASRM